MFKKLIRVAKKKNDYDINEEILKNNSKVCQILLVKILEMPKNEELLIFFNFYLILFYDFK